MCDYWLLPVLLYCGLLCGVCVCVLFMCLSCDSLPLCFACRIIFVFQDRLLLGFVFVLFVFWLIDCLLCYDWLFCGCVQDFVVSTGHSCFAFLFICWWYIIGHCVWDFRLWLSVVLYLIDYCCFVCRYVCVCFENHYCAASLYIFMIE